MAKSNELEDPAVKLEERGRKKKAKLRKSLLKKDNVARILDIFDEIDRFGEELTRQMQVHDNFVLRDNDKSILGVGSSPAHVWNNIIETQGYDKAQGMFLDERSDELPYFRLSTGAALEIELGLDLSDNTQFKRFILACSFTSLLETFEHSVNEMLKKLSSSDIKLNLTCRQSSDTSADELLLVSYGMGFTRLELGVTGFHEYTTTGKPHLAAIRALNVNFNSLLEAVMGNKFESLLDKLNKARSHRMAANNEGSTQQGDSHELIVH